MDREKFNKELVKYLRRKIVVIGKLRTAEEKKYLSARGADDFKEEFAARMRIYAANERMMALQELILDVNNGLLDGGENA